MEAGEAWTRWTIRVSFLLYFLALILPSRSRKQTGTRAAWTMACLSLAAHFLSGIPWERESDSKRTRDERFLR
jgi:hypothetical protein